MYIKPTVETTEEIHAEVSCYYDDDRHHEDYQTTVSLRLKPAHEFQIPKGNSTNSKCWNICTSDYSHLGILEQFNVGYRVHQYVGSNKIEYYRQESDVDTLEKALVQFVVFNNKNYKPTKVITRVITKTVVTRETQL